MSAATRHLGLGATLSTTVHTAYHLARWLGSLDVMSGGRVAWNVVTSATDLEAQNAGLELQRRGLFRTAYAGRTLRENLHGVASG